MLRKEATNIECAPNKERLQQIVRIYMEHDRHWMKWFDYNCVGKSIKIPYLSTAFRRRRQVYDNPIKVLGLRCCLKAIFTA